MVPGAFCGKRRLERYGAGDPGGGNRRVSLQLFHTAATPVGMEVRAESVVTAVDGKKITFTVTAYDEAGEIGHAQHERVIVKAERFLEKTYDKL